MSLLHMEVSRLRIRETERELSRRTARPGTRPSTRHLLAHALRSILRAVGIYGDTARGVATDDDDIRNPDNAYRRDCGHRTLT
jgi:hypothetical protein